MMEYNIAEQIVVPDMPKVVPNEVSYIYVPKASYTNPGVSLPDSETLLIDSNGKLFVNQAFIDNLFKPIFEKFGIIDRRISNIPVFTKETLPENPPKSYWYFKNEDEGKLEVQLWLDGITYLTSSSDKTYIRKVQADSFSTYFNGYYELTGKDIKKLKEFTDEENPYVPNKEGTKTHQCYILDGDKKNATVTYSVGADPLTLAKRDTSGRVRTATPSINTDATNKQYVDTSDTNVLNIAKKYTDDELAKFDFIKVVDVLPDAGLPNKIYFVPSQDPDNQSLFDEYVWINDSWEYISTKQLEVDLTHYATYEYVNNSFITKYYADANLADKLYVNEAIQQAFANIARAEGVSF